MFNIPEDFATWLLILGAAMIIACFTGKVSIKEFKFGSSNLWVRLILGIVGTLFVYLSLSSYYQPIYCKDRSFPSDPTTFVRDHYEGISSRAYNLAWQRLPEKLRNDKRVHPQGYPSFLNWFKKINPIRIKNIEIINCSNNYKVTVKVTYISGSSSEELKNIEISVLCKLRWNQQRNYWEFVDIIPI